MQTYTDTGAGEIELNGLVIPKDGGNRHYQEFLALQTAGEAELVEKTESTDEQAASIRAQRDRLLAASDWTQVADSPLTTDVKTAWATYRQALRDVPAQSTFPASVTWPPAPSE
jgi:hypothetical protein